MYVECSCFWSNCVNEHMFVYVRSLVKHTVQHTVSIQLVLFHTSWIERRKVTHFQNDTISLENGANFIWYINAIFHFDLLKFYFVASFFFSFGLSLFGFYLDPQFLAEKRNKNNIKWKLVSLQCENGSWVSFNISSPIHLVYCFFSVRLSDCQLLFRWQSHTFNGWRFLDIQRSILLESHESHILWKRQHWLCNGIPIVFFSVRDFVFLSTHRETK